MILWFIGGSWLIVWVVFRDPAIDFRLITLGVLLPDLVDAPFGGARVMHTLAAAVALLVIVMLATIGRRRARRRWLAVPIGVFIHLVLDGMWTQPHLFWWPLQGWSFEGAGLPSVSHPVPVIVAEEIAGLVALVWCAHRFGLSSREQRASFLRTGRLGRDITR